MNNDIKQFVELASGGGWSKAADGDTRSDFFYKNTV